ncbi:uncharacterized protein LOC142355523, partial [Convolutriloba macropyga]|uniref:uncharacterized protein LOC142355523 n=1 Tax=Convolutriloba macropyga TaxID=536237 RepID=UPI003F528071
MEIYESPSSLIQTSVKPLQQLFPTATEDSLMTRSRTCTGENTENTGEFNGEESFKVKVNSKDDDKKDKKTVDTDKPQVDVDHLLAQFAAGCAKEKPEKARAFSREYRTKEAFHIAVARPDNADDPEDEKWSMYPFGSILMHACVRWLEQVGGYTTIACIQRPHRPRIVLQIIKSFTGYGEGDVQIRSLDDIPDLETSDVMHAIREYLMFVRSDSIIPQCLLKHFIDKRKNMESLKKLMTTGYLTYECRNTLQVYRFIKI